MSPGFAGDALPVAMTLEAVALAGAVLLAVRALVRAWRNRRPRLAGSRRGYLPRLAWYRVTRRMPGRCPRRDRYKLTEQDRAVFGGLTTLYHERGVWADEPRYDRRQP